jgi:transcriptional regulator NrdR family protein
VIPCVRCGSSNTARPNSRGKLPRLVAGDRLLVRWHECRECGMEFRTYEFAITDRVTEDAIADIVEGAA